MKTLGILGGMSAFSTLIYYRELCRLTQARLGGVHSPELLIRSLDFAPIEALQKQDAWEALGELLAQEARKLEAAGAELLLIASNTMHKQAHQVVEAIDIPFLHIADATAQAIRARGLKRPALMATGFTMEQRFYTDKLRAAGLEPSVPNAEDRARVHEIIFRELVKGETRPESRAAYEGVAGRLAEAGADSLILGCTEVGMLLSDENTPVPAFDTALIHCEAALDAMLA